MNTAKLQQIAKDIIKSNIYLTLGTSDGKKPWTTPLFYACSDNYTFYFISQLDCLHVKHILQNPSVSFAIFDSHQKEGTGNGIQATGKASILNDNNLDEAFAYYHTSFIPMTKESFTGKTSYRFFQIISENFYILDPDAQTDKRVAVNLFESKDMIELT